MKQRFNIILFFIFYDLAFCKLEINCIFDKNPIIINFKPFDEIDIKTNGTVYLSYWKHHDGLYLNVDAQGLDGKIKEYGTFDPSSLLMSIKFDTQNYTLKFSYEGTKTEKLALIFSREDKDIPYFYFPYFSRYIYPDHPDYSGYVGPFYYDIDKGPEEKIAYFFFFAIFLLYMSFTIYYFRRKFLKMIGFKGCFSLCTKS